MAPFEAKGTEPQWKSIFDWAVKNPPGAILDWEKLTELLGYDPSRPGTARSPILKASKKLREERHRMLVSERGVGYRIAEASEHFGEAKKEQKSARRKLGQARGIAVSGDRNQLTPQQAKELNELTRVLSTQYAMLSRHDQEIQEIQEREQQRDARWEVLERTLKQHGITLPESKTVEGETVGEDS